MPTGNDAKMTSKWLIILFQVFIATIRGDDAPLTCRRVLQVTQPPASFQRKNHGFWLFTVYPLLWPLSWLDQKGGFELLEVSEKITKRRLWMATAWHINSVNDGIMFGNPSKNNVGWSYCCTQSFGPETFENCFKFCSAGLHCESSPLEISPLERKDHTWTAEHW